MNQFGVILEEKKTHNFTIPMLVQDKTHLK